MKTKDEIIAFFVAKKVLSNKSSLIRRPFNWKQHFDQEAHIVFREFARNYRSDEEAWFCLCRKVEPDICPVCNTKKVVFTGITKYGANGFNTTCEDCSANQVLAKKQKFHETCSHKTPEEKHKSFLKRKKTNKQRYGDENYSLYGSKSFKDNMLEKYGDENYNNAEQTQQTCLSKYGVPTNLLIPEVHEKSIENAWSDSARKKRTTTVMKKYNAPCIMLSDMFKETAQRTKRHNIKILEDANDCTLLQDVTKKYGQGYKSLGLEYLYIDSHVFVQNKDIPLIEKYSSEGTHTNGYVSTMEKDVLSFIKTIYNGEILENCTSVVPNRNHRFFELDMYFPELKLVIDFDGIYWHSLKFKDEFYHQRKTECCRDVGIHMLHIFEDNWIQHNDECKHLIEDVISGNFINIVSQRDDVIIGDNSKPVFGDIEILEITKPQHIHILKNEYCDCGKILYRRRGKKLK